MRFEAVLVALLAREAAAKCKSVTPSLSYAGPSGSAYPEESSSASSTFWYGISTTSSGYPAESSSVSSVYPSESSSASVSTSSAYSSSSSYVPSTTSSSVTSSSSSACPTPTDFVVGAGSCHCSYDVFDGFAIDGSWASAHDSYNFEDCLSRCDENTDCDSFMFRSRTCYLYHSRVNEGVTAVEDSSAKIGSLILASCLGTCSNPGPLPDYEPPTIEDPSTCQTTYEKKPPAYIRTTLETSTVVSTDVVTATTTEETTSTPTVLTTTTEYTTSTATETETQVTDTFYTTSTEYSTFVDTKTTTNVFTVIATSRVTVQPTTSTVAAPAGFTPIKSVYPGVVARGIKRVVAGRTLTPPSACPTPTPELNDGHTQTYATLVACATTVETVTTSTASTSTVINTITAAPTTVIETTISTIKTTTTEVPNPAETTISAVTTEVISTTVFVPTLSLTTSTTTITTTVGATPTVYAQCAAANLATTINGQRINYFSSTYQSVNQGTVSSGTDCCTICMNTAHCGAFYVTSTGRCYTATDSGTCNGSRKAASIAHSFLGSNFQVVGNGACGQAVVAS
ncbi:hypothetical protein F4677DRAFT_6218 [Hypoxylon crocopeplum]|nr:hypothetical protein F4677DRAFT_6218 [Hypoxylon crocopeplum]